MRRAHGITSSRPWRSVLTVTFSRVYSTGLTSIEAFGNPGPGFTPLHPSQLPDLVLYYSVIL